MRKFANINGVPSFQAREFLPKFSRFCLLIPVINEGNRIINELSRAHKNCIPKIVDIVVCDGGSSDGSLCENVLQSFGVNSLLIKDGPGKQGAQIRMGMWWALRRGYSGIITIDGNDKDSIEDVNKFVQKLDEGYDFVQGSRFVYGGRAVNTPFIRYLAVRLLHAPIISFTARKKFTDSTNAFRAYSKRYLVHPKVMPFRDIFFSYELLAYLSVRATQLRLRACEVAVSRVYPQNGKIPTKISSFSGNLNLLKILIFNFLGFYNPQK